MKPKLGKIYKSGTTMLEAVSLPSVYKRIVDEGIKFTGAYDGFFLLKTSRGYNTAYASSKSTSKITITHETARKVLSHPEKILILKKNELKKLSPEILSSPIKAVTLIPIISSKTEYGFLILRLQRPLGAPIKEEISMLKLFGTLASSSFKKAQYYTEMKKALELRDTFIAMAAHELRTPLTAILGYSQLLYKRLDSLNLNDHENTWIESLYAESNRLSKLVSDLLSVNRIKTGQVQYLFNQTRITEIILESIKRLSNGYKNRDITYQTYLTTENDYIIGDHSKLVEVFQYIIENGFDHSKPEDNVHVEVSERQSHYIVSVKDFGHGIAKEDLPRVLEGFYKKVEGKGFGVKLFLTNNIIQQHNGILTINSEVDHGTTVFVKLPKLRLD